MLGWGVGGKGSNVLICFRKVKIRIDGFILKFKCKR